MENRVNSALLAVIVLLLVYGTFFQQPSVRFAPLPHSRHLYEKATGKRCDPDTPSAEAVLKVREEIEQLKSSIDSPDWFERNGPFDPVSAARRLWPKLAEWDDARIRNNLSDPEKFRSAFPMYSYLDDDTIRLNMAVWEAYYAVSTEEDFRRRFDNLDITKQAKTFFHIMKFSSLPPGFFPDSPTHTKLYAAEKRLESLLHPSEFPLCSEL